MAKRKRTNTNRGYEENYSLITRGKAYQPFKPKLSEAKVKVSDH